MPLARIDISKDAPPERIKVVSEAIYGAMVEIANVPLHDKFQVVTRHAADEIIYPKEGYLGLTYTDDLILIQITWVAGRSTEVKKKFYKRIADEIHQRAQVRKEDVWIQLIDSAREDWSFGNGEMRKCAISPQHPEDAKQNGKPAKYEHYLILTRSQLTATLTLNGG
jgi:4-oxalocrotonate tautomerase